MKFGVNLRQLGDLEKDRGRFQYYFFSPIFEKDKNYSAALGEERVSISEKVSRIRYKQEDGKGTLDLLLFYQSDSFSIAFGTLTNRREIDTMGARLRSFGLYPFVVSKDKMFKILEGEYDKHVLREYRSGATQLQSYFKDHTGKEIILTRLEQDKKMGLKPYRATFALKNKKKQTVEIFHDGFMLTENPTFHLDLINELINVFVGANVELFNLAEEAVLTSKTNERLSSLRKILFTYANSESALTTFNKIETTLTYKKEETEKAVVVIMNQIGDWHISSKIVIRNFMKEDTRSIGVYFLTISGKRALLSTLRGDPYRAVQIYSAVDEAGILSEMKVV